MNLRDLRLQELSASVDSYRSILSLKQKEVDAARKQILRIGQELCGEAMQALLKEDSETISLETLASYIIFHAGTILKNVNGPPDSRQHNSEMAQEMDELRRQLDFQTHRAQQAETELANLKNTAESIERTTKAQVKKHEPNSPPISVEPDFSDWYDSWRASSKWERESGVVLWMGASGHARKSEIARELETRLEWKLRTVYSVIQQCQEDGLIQSEKGASAMGGRPSEILTLTRLGEWVYSKLASRPVTPNEYEALIKEHKSERHISLIYTVGDLFSMHGFQVQRDPIRIEIAENRYYQPDLAISKEGETFYLEVETGDRSDRDSLTRKWENAAIAGAGKICVVTPTPGLMTNFQGQINAWAVSNQRKVTMYLSNAESLRNKETGESPWVRVRQAPSA